METFGDTFAPTNQDKMKAAQVGTAESGGSVNPIQEAIKTLSYRVPRQSGGQGLAPSALLAGPGSAGVPQGGPAPNGVQLGLEQLLRMLFGGQMPGATPPSPYIVPGVTPGATLPGGAAPRAVPSNAVTPSPVFDGRDLSGVTPQG